MKKLILIMTALVVLTSAGLAQAGYGGGGEFSLTLFGSYGLSQAKDTSGYADNWSGTYWQNISEYADISYKADNGIFFGGAFTYMFGPNFGLQIGGGYFGRNIPNDTASGWEARWNPTSTWYSNSYDHSGTGTLSTIPIWLDFVGRFSSGMMDINISAGPTLFLNKAEATATGIYGNVYTFTIWPFTYSFLDFLPVAMEIPSTSWTGFGANFGLSIDFNLSPAMAFFLDARYFLCGPKELDWQYIAGYYDGQEGLLLDWHFTDTDYAAGLTTTYKLNPSFFVFGGGLKIRFGGGAL